MLRNKEFICGKCKGVAFHFNNDKNPEDIVVMDVEVADGVLRFTPQGLSVYCMSCVGIWWLHYMLSDALGDYCICGHEEAFHKNSKEDYPNGLHIEYCIKCYNQNGELACDHEFKLDNLLYVARRAKNLKQQEVN